MRKIIGLFVLTISFSFNHVAFAQSCHPDCKCRLWDVLDSGCAQMELACGTSGGAFPNCLLTLNHCCYYEIGSCELGSCGVFTFKKCYVGGCTYT